MDNLNEKPLAPAQRRARSRSMKRLAPKIARKKLQSKKEEKGNEVEQPTPDAAYDFKDIHTVEIYDEQEESK